MNVINGLIALAKLSELFDKWATKFAVEYHKHKVAENDQKYKDAMAKAVASDDTRSLNNELGKHL